MSYGYAYLDSYPSSSASRWRRARRYSYFCARWSDQYTYPDTHTGTADTHTGFQPGNVHL